MQSGQPLKSRLIVTQAQGSPQHAPQTGLANVLPPTDPSLTSGDPVGNACTDTWTAETKGPDMRDYRDAKAMAKTLRAALAQQDISLTHSETLELVARQFGVDNWNILAAKITDPPPQNPKAISFEQAVPIVRIFDVAKAHEFYLEFLGFSVDWEHRYGDDFPLYTQISRGGLKLHLSEHSGDASPGGNMCVYMQGIAKFHADLIAKNYRYMKPGLQDVDGRFEVTVTDPFNNRIRFMQVKT